MVVSGVSSKMSAESTNVFGHPPGQYPELHRLTSVQVVKTSVTVVNSPIQDYIHPDDHAPPTYEMTPGFKPFTIICYYNLIQKLCLFVCLCIELPSI